jgi:Cu2+-exporting ATPase
MERQSEHPIATAFVDYDTSAMKVESLQRLPGIGIKGIVNDVHYQIGNEQLIEEGDHNHSGLGDLVLYVMRDKECIAILTLNSEIRPEARSAIQYFTDKGIRTHLLSGDHAEQVNAMAVHLGFDQSLVRSRVTPEQKLEYINQLQAEGKLAVMVGDGLNDSPAMAAASVSIAMAKATDITKIHADMILMNEHLSLVSKAHNLSSRTRSIIQQNLTWAISYNLIGVPLAMMGFITPWIAALGMSLSSLIVVLNALRLSK